jgi:hypothetical protein
MFFPNFLFVDPRIRTNNYESGRIRNAKKLADPDREHYTTLNIFDIFKNQKQRGPSYPQTYSFKRTT